MRQDAQFRRVFVNPFALRVQTAGIAPGVGVLELLQPVPNQLSALATARFWLMTSSELALDRRLIPWGMAKSRQLWS
ncbi:hypothetical protein CHELA20_53836 [Hyphomicrobiales bacterium]|nr:hypothetical protein CHELA41_21091 [Hyphomicrobiales bacterium]CAH1685046.1 hypothetical protein CHELA20_53836 [Hyphomicrobiales bacterium]